MFRKSILILLSLLLALTPVLAESYPNPEVEADEYCAMSGDLYVEYGMPYSDPYEVALYLHAFIELPCNFISKYDAEDLGWSSSAGNLWDVTDQMSIGGNKFGNYEELLPVAKGRQYYECDVNYFGGYRGAERLVFSNDGLIYYTNDHYNTFTLLYDFWYWADVEYPLEAY